MDKTVVSLAVTTSFGAPVWGDSNGYKPATGARVSDLENAEAQFYAVDA